MWLNFDLMNSMLKGVDLLSSVLDAILIHTEELSWHRASAFFSRLLWNSSQIFLNFDILSLEIELRMVILEFGTIV
jgi:hypothetical protein